MSHVDRVKRLRKEVPYPPAQPPPMAPVDALPAVELPQLVRKLKAYKAVQPFLSGENQDRFRIIDASGNIDFYSYNHILEGSFRDNQFILTTSTRCFVLSGRNLDQIIDRITEHKVKALQEFIEGVHEPVTDSSAIFIEGIARE